MGRVSIESSFSVETSLFLESANPTPHYFTEAQAFIHLSSFSATCPSCVLPLPSFRIPFFAPRLNCLRSSVEMALFTSPQLHGGDTEGIMWRALHIGDYDKGYLRLLSQLTKAPEVPHGLWLEQFEKMRKRSANAPLLGMLDRHGWSEQEIVLGASMRVRKTSADTQLPRVFCSGCYFTVVAEHLATSRIVACATLCESTPRPACLKAQRNVGIIVKLACVECCEVMRA